MEQGMEPNEYLMKLSRMIKDLAGLDLFAGAQTLSKTEFRLLREIVTEERAGKGIISSELARRLGVTRSAVSQLVTKLEKRNIVMRTPSPTDRKIAYIRLSDWALEEYEEQCRQSNIVMDRVLEEMGEEKLQLLIAIYDEFSEIFGRALKECAHMDKQNGTNRKQEDKQC